MTYKEILERLIEQGERLRDRQINMDKYSRMQTLEEERKFDQLLMKIKSLKNVNTISN